MVLFYPCFPQVPDRNLWSFLPGVTCGVLNRRSPEFTHLLRAGGPAFKPGEEGVVDTSLLCDGRFGHEARKDGSMQTPG
jgi:hypothetical protein